IAADLGEMPDFRRYGSELLRDGKLRTERVQLLQVGIQHGLRGAGERMFEGLGGNVRIAVAVSTDPAPETQKALRASAEHTLPPCVERGQYRKKYVAQISDGDVDLIGDVHSLAAQRARLPEERDVPQDRRLDQL